MLYSNKENSGDDWKDVKNKHSMNMQIITCKNATKQKTKHFFISFFLSLFKIILQRCYGEHNCYILVSTVFMYET